MVTNNGGSKNTRILVRLDPDLTNSLKKHASTDSRSINSMIQHALKQYLRWKDGESE